jgi:hypothetical protein
MLIGVDAYMGRLESRLALLLADTASAVLTSFPSRLLALALCIPSFCFSFTHQLTIMAPKNKGKKGRKQDDDDFWYVTASDRYPIH